MHLGDDFLPCSRVINMKSKYNIQSFYYISSTFILFFGQRFRALSFLLLTRGLKGRVSFARQVVCHNMHGLAWSLLACIPYPPTPGSIKGLKQIGGDDPSPPPAHGKAPRLLGGASLIAGRVTACCCIHVQQLQRPHTGRQCLFYLHFSWKWSLIYVAGSQGLCVIWP